MVQHLWRQPDMLLVPAHAKAKVACKTAQCVGHLPISIAGIVNVVDREILFVWMQDRHFWLDYRLVAHWYELDGIDA